MNFTINLRPDLNYYEEAYSEIVKNNGLNRFEPVFAIAMILFAIVLWYQDNQGTLGFFPILFGGLGIFELIKVYTSRTKWVSERMKSGVTGQEINLQFTEDQIIHSGPFSTGDIKWTGIKSIGQTDKGIIIKPETGIAIYLPKTSFQTKEQIEFIINKGRK
jgi:hypothetical protein